MAKKIARIIASFNNVFFLGQIYIWMYHPVYKSEGLYPIRYNVHCYPAIKITSFFHFDIQIGDLVVLEYDPNKPEAYYITNKIEIQ